MPQKTIQDLDAYIKATAVVYDHSNTKLVSRKTKVSRRRKEAFLSVLPYGKPSSHYHSRERKTSSLLNNRKPRSKPAIESVIKNLKQKLKFSVKIPENADDDAPQTLSFQLDPETSVQSLKELIKKQIGVEARCQRLYIRRNFQLCDLLTLEENGVHNDEIISLQLSKYDRNCDDVPKDKTNIDDEYLKELSSKIESSWKELAKHLGYEEAEIADIQTANEGSTEESRHMLLTWWEKTADRDEAAQKLRRACEAIGFTENVPVTSKSRDEAAGPESERRQDAGADEGSKQNGAASTEEEKPKKKQVCHQDKPQLMCFRYVALQVFIRSHLSHRPTTMCLQIDPETSVATLKQIICEKISVRPQQQRLFIRRNFRNFELHNLLTLQDCGIHQDENISLRLCTDGLLGGGRKDTLPDSRSIQSLSEVIGKDWENLAIQLNFSKGAIEIFINDRQNDTVMQCFDMLNKWWNKQENYPIAWQTLEKALVNSGRQDLALRLSEFQKPAKNTDDTPMGTKDDFGTKFLRQLLVDLRRTHGDDHVIDEIIKFPQLAVSTDVTQNGTNVDVKTKTLRKKLAVMRRTHGEDYVINELIRFINSCDGELVDVKPGSVTFVVRIMSREGLDKLWSMYVTGELAKKLTEILIILITDELTTEDKSDLAIQATIQESDYEQACRFFDELERDQLKDKKDSSGMTEIQHKQEKSISTKAYSDDLIEHAADRYKHPVDVQFFQELASKTESSWEKLAKFLGFEEAEIKQIQTNFQENKERSLQMLLPWWRKQTNREEVFQSLRDALNSIRPAEMALMMPSEEQQRMKREELGHTEKRSPSPERQIPRQEEAAHHDKPHPEKQAGDAKEQSKEKGTRSSEGERPRQEEVAHRDKHQPEVQARGAKGQGKQKRITSAEGERPRQEEVAHRDKPRLEVQVGGAKEKTIQKGTSSSQGQRLSQEGVAHRVKPKPDVQVGVTETESRRDTLPDDRSVWNTSKKIGRHWAELALNLNFSKENIHIIKANHSNDVVRQCFEMLSTWWRKQKDYTEARQTLEKALNDSGRDDLVRVASDKHPVDDQFFRDLASKTESSWEALAKFLGHEETDIKQIQTTFQDDKERSLQILLSWWRKQTNREEGFQSLRDALSSIRCTELALMISTEEQQKMKQEEFGHPEEPSPSVQSGRVKEQIKQKGTTSSEGKRPSQEDVGHRDKPELEVQLRGAKEKSKEKGTTSTEGKRPRQEEVAHRDTPKPELQVGGATEKCTQKGTTSSEGHSPSQEDVGHRDKPELEVQVRGAKEKSKEKGTKSPEKQRPSQEEVAQGKKLQLEFQVGGAKEKSKEKGTPSSEDQSPKQEEGVHRDKPKPEVQVGAIETESSQAEMRRARSSPSDAADQGGSELRNRYTTTGTYVQLIRWVDDDMEHITSDIFKELQLEQDDQDDVEGNVKVRRVEGTLPSTLSRLFSEAVRCIFRRKMPELSEEAISEVVIAIGKVALEGLVSPEQRLSFQEGDFEKSALDKAIQAGILTSQRDIKLRGTHNNVQFTHKTLQEYCAAMYCRSLFSKGGGEFQKILDKLGYPMNFEYVLRFCCGDNEQCTWHVLRMLHEKNLQDKHIKRKPVKELALNCYFESQARDLLSVDFIESFFTGDIELSGNDSVNSFVWLLQHAAEQTELSGVDYLAKVSEIHLEACNLLRLSEVVALHLTTMKNLRVLDFDKCTLTGSNVNTLLSSLRNGGNLTEISLGMSDLGGSAKDWAVQLQGMKCLEKLSLHSCCLGPRDVVDIASSTGELPNLTELNLYGNMGLGGNAETWATSLQSMIHLKKLDMSNCSINSRDLKYIVESVSRMQNLVDCDFSSYPEEWRVQSCSNGIELSIKDFSLTVKDLVDVVQPFNNRSNLVGLTIHGICGMGGSAGIWTPLLQNLTELQELELSDCSLHSTDIEHLAASLRQMPNLTDLNISENSNLGCHAGTWAACLQKMIHLKSLGLWECNINEQDLAHIASSVGDMPNLAHLSLSWNEGLGGHAETWVACLQKMIHLKSLDLWRCDINGKDLSHIASSVGEMPNLTDLNLSCNKELGGNAKTWAASLRKMIHLKSLNLSKCAINEQDLPHIASSVGKMSNLTDLNLSRKWDFSRITTTWPASLQRWIYRLMRNLDTDSRDTSAEECRVLPCDNGIQLSIHRLTLIGGGMADILQPFSNRSDLVMLTLRGIGLGGSSEIWTPPLQNMTELRELDLIHCSLQSTDIEHLAAAVSRMSTLESLSLEGNDSLSGSAQTWACCLKQMKHVKSLKLGDCSLTEEDKNHISEARAIGVDFGSSEDD